MNRHDIDDFPEGVYVQVSTIEDLFAILTDRPVRAILELNKSTASALLGSASGGPGGASIAPVVLPFPKREIILSLDPFLPQGRKTVLPRRSIP
jgi:putative protease